MRSINKVILIGNLTRDPEMRQTPNGQKVVTFGIATNREWVSDGKKNSSTEFHDLVAWARLADIAEKFLKKGKLIYVEGYLKTRSWDTDGIKKFRTEIVVQDLIILEKRDNNEQNDMYEKETTEAAINIAEQERPAKNPIDKIDKKEPSMETTSKTPVASASIDDDLGL